MPRPPGTDWASLELAADPAPGDPDDIERLAVAYGRLAAGIAAGWELLSGCGPVTDASGTAIRSLNARLGALPARMTVAGDCYVTAAATLRRYADVLRDCRQRADLALAQVRHPHTRPDPGDELPVVRQRALDADADRRAALEATLRALGQLAELLDPPATPDSYTGPVPAEPN